MTKTRFHLFSLIAVVVSCVIFSCTKQPLVDPPVTVTVVDGSIPNGSVCERACFVLAACGCEEALVPEAGACQSKCVELQDVFDFTCIANMGNSNTINCADLLSCNVRCLK